MASLGLRVLLSLGSGLLGLPFLREANEAFLLCFLPVVVRELVRIGFALFVLVPEDLFVLFPLTNGSAGAGAVVLGGGCVADVNAVQRGFVGDDVGGEELGFRTAPSEKQSGSQSRRREFELHE